MAHLVPHPSRRVDHPQRVAGVHAVAALAELLRPARAVRVAANVTPLPLEQDQALAGALEELTEVLRILDDEQP